MSLPLFGKMWQRSRNRITLASQESYDDLDFLVFTILSLSLTSRVALVSHINAPVPGIEICVQYDRSNIGEMIAQTLDQLNLTPEDLTWIDPQYDREEFKQKTSNF
jgi:hypothetical protein